jgi:hypothetical protein
LNKVYWDADGPSFSLQQFFPKLGNEADGIDPLIEANDSNLFAQTIIQTAVRVPGAESTMSSKNCQI